jgi:glutathione-specific gamma-glutamylcyclotransferase
MREDLWVFGYGSLLWRQGFPHVEARGALLRGWHRALCVTSVEHRGTPEFPGVVLGLDRGGVCRGMVFRVAARHAVKTLIYLDEREMGTYSYRQVFLPVVTPKGVVRAFTHVVERNHPHYAGDLSDTERVRRIAAAVGQSGANLDYLANTLRHLTLLGVRDRRLEMLYAAARTSASRSGAE